MSKFRLWVLSIFCLLAIAISILCFFIPRGLAPQNAQGDYYLRDCGGKVALYRSGEDSPLEVYEIYTRLLPETDVLALQAGVCVENRAKLQALLEDYGL